MTLITPGLLGSRGQMMPGRKTVYVYQQLARDVFAAPFAAIAEVRPVVRNETGNADANSNEYTRQFIFQQVELGAKVLSGDDIIAYGSEYWRIGSISVDLLDQRVKCESSATIDPTIEIT